MRTSTAILAAVAIAGSLAGRAGATTTTYTSQADFEAVLAGIGEVAQLGFNGVATGVQIASGSALGGVTFTYALAGDRQLVVVDTVATTSGTHSLGTTGDGSFHDPDVFTIDFPPAVAVGLYVIGQDLAPASVTLQTDVGDVPIAAADVALSGGRSGYFVGLIESDPAQALTSATITSAAIDGGIAWNVDDIHIVPEPAATSGAAVAGAALAAIRRARARRGITA